MGMTTDNFQSLEFEDTIDLRQYLDLLRQWAWLIVLAAVLAGATAFVVSQVMTPIYQAKTRILIKEPPSTKSSEYSALLTSERLAKTYSEMLTTQPVLAEVIQELGLDYTVKELKDVITVKQIPNTQLIEVSVEDPSPQRAADIANTLVTVFSARVNEIERQSFEAAKQRLLDQMKSFEANIRATQEELQSLDPSQKDRRAQLEASLTQYNQTYSTLLQTYEDLLITEAQSASNVHQVEPATPPERPVRPRTLLNTLLAAIVGAMLAVGGVFLFQALDTSIRTPDEVNSQFNLPVLGFVPVLSGGNHKNGAAPLIEPRSPEAEAYRALRANLEFVSPDKPLQVVLITSSGPGEGKSLTAVNLAHILAQAGKKVTLVDCDFRKPTVHKKLGLKNRIGLSSVFRGAALDTVVHELLPNLHVITSGPLPPNPSELLASKRMQELLADLRSNNHIIVLDGPPGFISDTSFLASMADGVLIVAQPGETDRNAIRYLLDQLHRANANIVGMVFNRVQEKQHYYQYYYTQNYKYYQAEN